MCETPALSHTRAEPALLHPCLVQTGHAGEDLSVIQRGQIGSTRNEGQGWWLSISSLIHSPFALRVSRSLLCTAVIKNYILSSYLQARFYE